MGPLNQLKGMFASTRIIATILVFACMGMTIFAALGVSTNVLKNINISFDYYNISLYIYSFDQYHIGCSKDEYSKMTRIG